MPERGAPMRPMNAANRGRGKELPLEEAGTPIPAVPRNRRERRALAAWKRKQAKAAEGICAVVDVSQERWRDHARDTTRPVVTVDPRVRFGRPQINGISVEAIAELILAGEDVDTVCDECSMSRPQMLVACWYIAFYGPPRYRRLWASWLAKAEGPLAHGHYTAIPDPPSRQEAAS